MKRAFTLIELLVVIAIIALLIGILVPALGEARRTAQTAKCHSNLKQFNVGYNSYSAEYENKIASFTWNAGHDESIWSDLTRAGNDWDAAMDQLIWIIRRRSGDETFPRLRARLPHRRYSHIVMLDYLSSNLPEPIAGCPADKKLINIASDPQGSPDWAGSDYPRADGQGGNQAWHRLWPFSSSYQVVPVSWNQDQGNLALRPPRRVVDQYLEDHNLFWMNDDYPFGRRKISEVQFPAQKVFMFDMFQRHFGSKQPYHSHEFARQPLAFFDGSVRIFASQDINDGFRPNSPTNGQPTRYKYWWDSLGRWEPAPMDEAAGFDWVTGKFRWTRGGLRGVDVGGSEIDTGQL